MKVKDQIPQSIITAAVAMLQAFVPELTPTKLIEALQEYENDKQDVNARPKPPYTIAAICRLLQVSKPTIYRMAKRGELPLVKIGNSTRVPAEAADRLLKVES